MEPDFLRFPLIPSIYISGCMRFLSYGSYTITKKTIPKMLVFILMHLYRCIHVGNSICMSEWPQVLCKISCALDLASEQWNFELEILALGKAFAAK